MVSSTLGFGGLAIRNPWDVILPEYGDDARATTAEAKGEAISQWELSEVALSRLYASVCDVLPKERHDKAKSYGTPLNFKDRLDRLERQGESFFAAKCSQMLEGDFEDVIQLARMLSMRRNEIVHSFIKGITYERTFREDENGQTIVFKAKFFVVPPDYTARKFDDQHRPGFFYSSVEMDHYRTEFGCFQAAALNLSIRLDGGPIEPFGRKHPVL